MLHTGQESEKKGYGPETVDGVVRWAPSGDTTQTLSEARGVTGVTRTGAGAYTVQLPGGIKDIEAVVGYVDDDTTHFHFADITSIDQTDRKIYVRHRSVAFASVASGPSASDTVDQLIVMFSARKTY